MNTPRVVLFDEGFAIFGARQESMREILGGKGAGLAEMVSSGVAVPPGMTILTTVCREYFEHARRLPTGLMDDVREKLSTIERQTGKRIGDPANPLLLSVRSGSKFSMPGMMDTILNVGMNEEVVHGLATSTKNPRFAWDSYRRLLQMYGNVVLSVPKERFEHILTKRKLDRGASADAALSESDLRDVAREFVSLIERETRASFPSDPIQQIEGAIRAVFDSWMNQRAVYYRALNKIDENLGTAVTIQSMVFGNFDDSSATGVCFTRDPSTGERVLYGEYLVNAQGEDVVAGTRTPKKIADMAREFPSVHRELTAAATKLEAHYRDVQDIEFTVEKGKLFLLQTRTGKRTAAAAVRTAVEMAREGLLSRDEALLRVSPASLTQLLLPSFIAEERDAARASGRHLATGLNASPGAAIGAVVFDPEEAERLGMQGKKVILVRVETCPDDLPGIVPAQGVVTSRGGMTSHAAVVARGMGKPCVAGCDAVVIDYEREEMTIGGIHLRKGDIISIDGSTGEIFKGALPTAHPTLGEEFDVLLQWADDRRTLGVRANADTPEDAERGRRFGAEGIGLCRTEHMFMSPERLPVMQAMIMASDLEERRECLARLLPMQREDFVGLFRAMRGFPVTIRLLDPPLHEFLPKLEDLIEEVTLLKAKGVKGAEIRQRELLLQKVRSLHESNPMMGLRGCRLGLLYPEVSEMQVEAIFEAAILAKEHGIDVLPEIMIPLVGHSNELRMAREYLEAVAERVMTRERTRVQYRFGTMIEIPRACVTADEIAVDAEFFSFGTNDLTQMTFGFSRDDAEGRFLQRYLEGLPDASGQRRKVLHDNPFETLDRSGVGALMKIAVEKGSRANPKLKTGICGEHGGDPASITFAHEIGLSYVSCSPFRVPIARLSAAQSAIRAQ